MRTLARMVAAGLAAGVTVSCAGLGELTQSSAGGDGGGPDGTTRDGGGEERAERSDSGAKKDATGAHDATSVDASRDHATAHDGPSSHDGGDAGLPEAAPPVITCALSGNVTLVDDLANRDAASGQFAPRIYVAPTSNRAGFYVIAQVQGDDTEFVAYSVAVGGGVPIAETWPSPPQNGVQLLDVLTTGSGQSETIDALVTHTIFAGGAGTFTGLELVPIPSAFEEISPGPMEFQGFVSGGVSGARMVTAPPPTMLAPRSRSSGSRQGSADRWTI